MDSLLTPVTDLRLTLAQRRKSDEGEISSRDAELPDLESLPAKVEDDWMAETAGMVGLTTT